MVSSWAQNFVWWPYQLTKMAATAEFSLTLDPMRNYLFNFMHYYSMVTFRFYQMTPPGNQHGKNIWTLFNIRPFGKFIKKSGNNVLSWNQSLVEWSQGGYLSTLYLLYPFTNKDGHYSQNLVYHRTILEIHLKKFMSGSTWSNFEPELVKWSLGGSI